PAEPVDTQSVEKSAQWHEIATKIDLARAYQEMGDNDGAKEILQEVLKDGDTEQQESAKSILESL
ncbi:MAG: FimV/HubP family polar landmark protein, partial [Nitrosomonadaceae bacterium]